MDLGFQISVFKSRGILFLIRLERKNEVFEGMPLAKINLFKVEGDLCNLSTSYADLTEKTPEVCGIHIIGSFILMSLQTLVPTKLVINGEGKKEFSFLRFHLSHLRNPRLSTGAGCDLNSMQ